MDTWPLRLRHVSIDGNMIELVQSLPVVAPRIFKEGQSQSRGIVGRTIENSDVEHSV